MNQSIATPVDAGLEPRLHALAKIVLEEAEKAGATSAEMDVSESQGLSVNVRNGDIETVEHNRDKSLSVTTYAGHSRGSASSADFSEAAVRDTVRAAVAIAKHTAEDDAIGLASADRMATEFPDLDLHHPWDVSMDDFIDIAMQCEAEALNQDERINNTEGASVSSHDGMSLYANSHGFVGRQLASRHSLGCSVIGESEGGMQRDYWYTSARDAADLDSAELVGQIAAERTLRRLDARQIPTTQCPVLYEAPIASSLIGHFLGAINGRAQHRKTTFLLGMAGEAIFPSHIRIYEEPRMHKGPGSANFDTEGVATADRDWVTAGVLETYLMSSYSARKLGLESTGNAGGVRNLAIESDASGGPSRDALLDRMGHGLLVTELIGFGVNNVTGDYSRGAAGFWVENGQIEYPVEEVTIAGNLKDMYMNIVDVGSDVDRRGNLRTGSILIGEMTVAGG